MKNELAKRWTEEEAANTAAVYFEIAEADGFSGESKTARAVWLARASRRRIHQRSASAIRYKAQAEWSGAAYRGMCRRQWAINRS